ncbi:hypothetical protein GCM10027580_20190 [Corynebacterium faecale]
MVHLRGAGVQRFTGVGIHVTGCFHHGFADTWLPSTEDQVTFVSEDPYPLGHGGHTREFRFGWIEKRCECETREEKGENGE